MTSLATDPASLRIDETGTWRVAGSRITLDILVNEYRSGATPEDIVSAYDTLALADVYGALGCYLRHREEFDAYLARRREEAARLRQEIEAAQGDRGKGLKEKLLARLPEERRDASARR